MKKNLVAFALIVLIPSLAIAEKITVSVTGMVCAFCAQGIKKTVLKIPGVTGVEPELKTQSVIITTDAKTTLSDEQVETVIADAGYSTVKIERQK